MSELDLNQHLIHRGNLLQTSDGMFGRKKWIEVFVLLFDNCCKLFSFRLFTLGKLVYTSCVFAVILTMRETLNNVPQYGGYGKVGLSGLRHELV